MTGDLLAAKFEAIAIVYDAVSKDTRWTFLLSAMGDKQSLDLKELAVRWFDRELHKKVAIFETALASMKRYLVDPSEQDPSQQDLKRSGKGSSAGQ